MERQRRDDRARQRRARRIDDVIVRAGEMQHAQHDEQRNEARHDAREAHRVERARIDAAERGPAPQRKARDQEARDHEEHDDRVVAAPEHDARERLRQQIRHVVVVQRETEIDVVQNDEQHRKPAQQIDAGIAPVRCRHRGDGSPIVGRERDRQLEERAVRPAIVRRAS